MASCQQTETQTILQHGESVWEHTKKLILGDFEGFKLPDWFIENHHFIINNLHDWEVIKQYNVYHDCGKPFCLEVDSEGRKHFPNHAEVSKQTYLEHFPDDKEVAELIGLDMLFHTSNFAEIDALNLPTRTLLTLMVTAFAELHSNARMFGGIESTSFKIKYKKLEKSGRKVIENLKKYQDAYSYVIVRTDLPEAQQTVQACHAIWEESKKHTRHPSVVCVAVKSEHKLKKTMEKLIDNNVNFSIFREPLFNNTITAICTKPLVGAERDVLKQYMLLA